MKVTPKKGKRAKGQKGRETIETPVMDGILTNRPILPQLHNTWYYDHVGQDMLFKVVNIFNQSISGLIIRSRYTDLQLTSLFPRTPLLARLPAPLKQIIRQSYQLFFSRTSSHIPSDSKVRPISTIQRGRGLGLTSPLDLHIKNKKEFQGIERKIGKLPSGKGGRRGCVFSRCSLSLRAPYSVLLPPIENPP